MKTILQLSDFHIKLSYGAPETNIVFQGLLKELKEKLGPHPILVYNGDVIDLGVIRKEVSKLSGVPGVDISAEWYKRIVAEYDLAEKYFRMLIAELNINNNDIIICCGNHDVFSYGHFDPATAKKIDCPSSVIKTDPKYTVPEYTPDRFTPFSTFCKNVTGNTYEETTSYRKIQGINFLIANSNWIDKRKPTGEIQNLCIDCQGVNRLIDENRVSLNNTKERSKLQNVFVAHAPLGDYCEFGINDYPENKYEASWPEVNRYFGLKLFGDKHTPTANNYDYIVGAPLDSPEITYGIHVFDNNNKYHHRSVVFRNNAWHTIGSEDDIIKVLNISKASLKSRAIEYLYRKDGEFELERKIASFPETRTAEPWNNLDKFLRSSADIQKAIKGRAGAPISSKDGFINTLTSLISDSSNRVSVAVKGEARLGKSICMTLLYLNMLYRYFSGTFEYLPIYIDVERVLDKCRGKSNEQNVNREGAKARREFSEKVEEFFKESVTYAHDNNRSICCIVDGLNEYYEYENNKTEDVVDNFLSSDDYGPYIQRVVYCIDLGGGSSSLGSTPQGMRRDAEYLVYFKRVLSKVGSRNKKAESLIQSFALLQKGGNKDQARVVYNNITRLNIPQIDPNLLVQFWDSLKENNCDSYFSLLDSYVEKRVSRPNMAKVAKACFDYTVGGKTYQDIQKQISNIEFDLIRSEKNVIEYFLAFNYVAAINNPTEANLPALDRVYGHSICALIREHIRKRNASDKLVQFAKKAFLETDTPSISLQGISTVIYLLGRVVQKKSTLKGLLANYYTKKRIISSNDSDPQTRFYSAVARRSCLLSLVLADSTRYSIDNYIRCLLSDDFERKVNRMFYLQFYGDRMDAYGENIVSVPIIEGFDIFYTFHILSNRLIEVKSEKDKYPLMELELFTLCDMIQMRIDSPNALSRAGCTVPSFFYNNKKYNKPKDDMAVNVMSLVRDIVQNYLNLFGTSNKDKMFICYLQMCLSHFSEKLTSLKAGSLSSETDIFMPNSLINRLMELGEVKRVGWSLEKTPESKLGEKEIKELQSGPIVESTQTHTVESYYIALLYLPNKSDNSLAYDKQKVLNTLMIHDLGEIEVGDILPAFEDYDERRAKEKLFCERLFLQSIHNDVSDLSECFDLWSKWCVQEDYNAKVAKDIDIIQRLFKMLCLLQKKTISFTQSRAQEFWNDRKEIHTIEGRKVFDVLISGDERFGDVSKAYGLNMSKLLSE